MLLQGTTFIVKAEEYSEDTEITINQSEEISRYMTYEMPMPKETVFSVFTGKGYEKKLNSWKNETKEYLETFYNQRVIEVKEDNEKITFIFERDQTGYIEQIVSVEYYKNQSKSVEGDTKVTTIDLGWDNNGNIQSMDDITIGDYAEAGLSLISMCPKFSWYLSTFISVVASAAGYTINAALPIRSETRYVSYSQRKVGSYFLSTGVWYPNVQILRRDYWYYKTIYQAAYSGGPAIPRHDDNIPNSTHSNSSSYDQRPHYNDHTWIKNKSAEIANTTNCYFDIW